MSRATQDARIEERFLASLGMTGGRGRRSCRETGWLAHAWGVPPMFFVCAGNKAVTGEWPVCRGAKGLSGKRNERGLTTETQRPQRFGEKMGSTLNISSKEMVRDSVGISAKVGVRESEAGESGAEVVRKWDWERRKLLRGRSRIWS
jgi:hypothetical protein